MQKIQRLTGVAPVVNALPYFQLYMWRIYLGDFFVLQLALTPANHGWQGLPRDVCQ